VRYVGTRGDWYIKKLGLKSTLFFDPSTLSLGNIKRSRTWKMTFVHVMSHHKLRAFPSSQFSAIKLFKLDKTKAIALRMFVFWSDQVLTERNSGV